MILELFRQSAGAGVGIIGKDDEAEGVHHFAVEKDIQLDQTAGTVIRKLIIEAGIAAAAALERIKEIVDDLGQRQIVMQLHTGGIEVLGILVDAAALLTEIHQGTDIFRRGEDACLDIRLLRLRNGGGIRVVGGVINGNLCAVGEGEVVDNAGGGGDEIEIEFPLQTLLNDLHVEKPQKAAAEAEAQGSGGFRLIGKGSVIELQLFQCLPQIGIFGAIGRVDAAEHHGIDAAVAGKRCGSGVFGTGDGIAHTGIGNGFDAGGEIANLAGGDLLPRD